MQFWLPVSHMGRGTKSFQLYCPQSTLHHFGRHDAACSWGEPKGHSTHSLSWSNNTAVLSDSAFREECCTILSHSFNSGGMRLRGRKGIKQLSGHTFSHFRMACVRMCPPQWWIVLQHQGDPQWTLHVASIGKHVHFCGPEPGPNLLHCIQVNSPLVCHWATRLV